MASIMKKIKIKTNQQIFDRSRIYSENLIHSIATLAIDVGKKHGKNKCIGTGLFQSGQNRVKFVLNPFNKTVEMKYLSNDKLIKTFNQNEIRTIVTTLATTDVITTNAPDCAFQLRPCSESKKGTNDMCIDSFIEAEPKKFRERLREWFEGAYIMINYLKTGKLKGTGDIKGISLDRDIRKLDTIEKEAEELYSKVNAQLSDLLSKVSAGEPISKEEQDNTEKEIDELLKMMETMTDLDKLNEMIEEINFNELVERLNRLKEITGDASYESLVERFERLQRRGGDGGGGSGQAGGIRKHTTRKHKKRNHKKTNKKYSRKHNTRKHKTHKLRKSNKKRITQKHKKYRKKHSIRKKSTKNISN